MLMQSVDLAIGERKWGLGGGGRPNNFDTIVLACKITRFSLYTKQDYCTINALVNNIFWLCGLMITPIK